METETLLHELILPPLEETEDYELEEYVDIAAKIAAEERGES